MSPGRDKSCWQLNGIHSIACVRQKKRKEVRIYKAHSEIFVDFVIRYWYNERRNTYER